MSFIQILICSKFFYYTKQAIINDKKINEINDRKPQVNVSNQRKLYVGTEFKFQF